MGGFKFGVLQRNDENVVASKRLTPAAERDPKDIWLYLGSNGGGTKLADRYTVILANAELA